MQNTGDVESTLKSWTEAQQRIWDQWVSSFRGGGNQNTGALWLGLLDAWEMGVKQALDSQAQALLTWLQASGTRGDSEEARAASQRGEELIRTWTQSQRQIWESWFGVARNMATAQTAGSGEGAGQDAVGAWQDVVRKSLESQATIMRSWASAFSQMGAGTGRSGGSSSGS